MPRMRKVPDKSYTHVSTLSYQTHENPSAAASLRLVFYFEKFQRYAL